MSQPEDEETKEHVAAVPPPSMETDAASDSEPSDVPPPLLPPVKAALVEAAPVEPAPVPTPAWQAPAAPVDDRPPTEPVPTPLMAPPISAPPVGQPSQAPLPSQQWQPTSPQTGQWQQPTQPPTAQVQPPAAQQWQGSPQYPSQPGWAPQPGYPPQGYAQPGYPPQGYPQPGHPPQGYAPTGPMYSTSALVAVAGLLLAVFGLIGIVAGVWLLGQADELRQFIQRTSINFFGSRLEQETLRAILSPMPGVLLIWGALEVILAAGIFAHKGWARALAILLSLLGILVGIAGVSFALALAPGASPALIAAMVVLLGYAFIVLALIAGGSHFRRRYPQR